MSKKFFKIFIVVGFFLFTAQFGLADPAGSTNYQLSEGQFTPGGFSSSANFLLNGAISQISIGPSVADNFNFKAGLLYFPMLTTPIVSVSATSTQVDLTWTPSLAELGWTVGGYAVGVSTSSGGPYELSDVGMSTNYLADNLTNGTTYYFVIKVKDNLNNYIATSTQVSAVPNSPVIPPPPDDGGGGGGGGGGGQTGSAVVNFSGMAYPLSNVSLFKDGQIAASTSSGPDAKFNISLSALSAGSYNFGVTSIDKAGNQAPLQNFPITLTTGAIVSVSGIFIAPSIDVDKQQVKQGDNISIFGQSVPNGEVVIAVNSEQEIFARAKTNDGGAYLYNLDTSVLEKGDHSAKSKAIKQNELSPFGASVGFIVGNTNILKGAKDRACNGRGDLNNDCRVNLVDFSIAAYWYKRPLVGSVIIQKEKSQLNGDGKIDLTDLSIIAYYWNG